MLFCEYETILCPVREGARSGGQTGGGWERERVYVSSHAFAKSFLWHIIAIFHVFTRTHTRLAILAERVFLRLLLIRFISAALAYSYSFVFGRLPLRRFLFRWTISALEQTTVCNNWRISPFYIFKSNFFPFRFRFICDTFAALLRLMSPFQRAFMPFRVSCNSLIIIIVLEYWRFNKEN